MNDFKLIDIPLSDDPRWKALEPGVFAVRSEALLMSELGLMRALMWIPLQERRGYSGFRWAGEYRDDQGRRWLKIEAKQG